METTTYMISHLKYEKKKVICLKTQPLSELWCNSSMELWHDYEYYIHIQHRKSLKIGYIVRTDELQFVKRKKYVWEK